MYEFSRDSATEQWTVRTIRVHAAIQFYQAFADIHDMMELTQAMVCDALQNACGTLKIPYQGRELDFTPPWPRVSMLDSVSEGGRVVHALDEAVLRKHSRSTACTRAKAPGAGGMLDELFSALVQPELQNAAFVVDFPVVTSRSRA